MAFNYLLCLLASALGLSKSIVNYLLDVISSLNRKSLLKDFIFRAGSSKLEGEEERPREKEKKRKHVGNHEEKGKEEKKASLREFIHPLPQFSLAIDPSNIIIFTTSHYYHRLQLQFLQLSNFKVGFHPLSFMHACRRN